MATGVKEKQRRPSLTDRLLNGTILGSWVRRCRTPEAVINLMRDMAGETPPDFNENAQGRSLSSAYQSAKDRLNRLWSGIGVRPAELDDPSAQTPTARFKTLRGVLTSYWTGEKRLEAWTQTGVIGSLSLMNAQNTVWVAEAFAQFINSLAGPEATASLQQIGTLGATTAASIALGWGLYKTTNDMQRRMSGWMTGKFNEAVFAKPDIIHRFTHNRNEESKDPDAMPDNPHSRMSQSVRSINRNLIHLSEGAFSTVATSAFIAMAIHEKSVPVDALDRLASAIHLPAPGNSGLMVLAGLVAGGYVAGTFYKARKFAKAMEDNDKKSEKAFGDLNNTLKDAFDNGSGIAASKGHRAHHALVTKNYAAADETWRDDNRIFGGYLNFMNAQQLVGANLVAPLPGFAARTSGNLSFEGFMASHSLILAFINKLYFVFNAIPQYSNMKANADRVKEMAQMIDKVQDRQEFYRLSGKHDFKYGPIENDENGATLLRVRNMSLLHRGQQDNPFITLENATFYAGDWIYVKGISGSGKTTLMKSLCGLHPYGEGNIEMSADARSFFACQQADINGRRSLAEQVIYGASEDETISTNLQHDVAELFSDPSDQKVRIAKALQIAGLGEFAGAMDEKTHNGKLWQDILSGGQKQRLVLARILYQNPDIIFLDEAASALDPEARSMFFSAIREHCPQACVMAIIHADQIPHHFDGTPLFNRTMTVEKNGSAHIDNHFDDATASEEEEDTRATGIATLSAHPGMTVH